MEEINPIKTYEELIEFDKSIKYEGWRTLIPLQRKRGNARFYTKDYTSMLSPSEKASFKKPKRDVLIIHDMMGNYREDKKFKSSKKWDDYRFYHWAGVDYFCYFSHEFISIPPAGWTCAAHLHGVSVLGLFLIEMKQTSIIDSILKSKENIEKTCHALVSLCEYYNFEGYLLIIYTQLGSNQVSMLKDFIKLLTEKIHHCIPNGVVLFYESVTSAGENIFQNQLNDENREFLDISDGIVVHFGWADEHLYASQQIVNEHYEGFEKKIFFAIDAFGREQIGELHCNTRLHSILDYNYSVAFFAPGWTYESMTDHGFKLDEPEGDESLNEEFLKRNELFWHLLCEHLPVNSYTKLPLYSNFCLGSGKKRYDRAQPTDESFFDLTVQSLQPSVPLHFYKRNFEDAVDGGCCLEFPYPNWTRLFATEYCIKKTLIFGFAYKSGKSHSVSCILTLRKKNSKAYCRLICGPQNKFTEVDGKLYLPYVEPQNECKVIKLLHQMGQKLVIPFTLANDWNVRYYVVSFDTPVAVWDIGAGVENLVAYKDTCLLGAVYLHGGDAFEEDNFVLDTKKFFYEGFARFGSDETGVNKVLAEEKKKLAQQYKIE